MRRPRNFQTDRCYHLVSRVAHRAFYMDEDERTRFSHSFAPVDWARDLLAVLADKPEAPGRPSQGVGRLQPELLHLVLSDAPCGGGLHCVRGSPSFAAANISPDGEGLEGIGMKLLHHSYSTNGVRPSSHFMYSTGPMHIRKANSHEVRGSSSEQMSGILVRRLERRADLLRHQGSESVQVTHGNGQDARCPSGVDGSPYPHVALRVFDSTL